jgi:two-component system OmpR family sensor kinase
VRRGNPVARYVWARLHRRIFFLLGGAIFFTGLIFVAAQWYLGSEEWQREVQGARGFFGGRFERVRDEPEQRDELGRALANELHVGVEIEGADHAIIASFGRPCRHPLLTAPVVRGRETLGYASVCADRAHAHPRGAVIVPFLVGALVLWGLSGKLARRLARPYAELARVAHDIGVGKLSSRFSLSRRAADGEARMLAHAINDMADRIEKQMTDQRELLAGVSHEIRTPLSRIRLLVELCRAGAKGDGGSVVSAKTLDEIDREVVEIDALVGELLASSRLDFAALSPHELDAADLAQRALERLGEKPGKLLVLPGPTRITADATLLARALANLIENAASHGGGLEALVVRAGPGVAGGSANGASGASAEAGKNVLVFEALDRGPGFLPGEEERVFESFYQRPGAEPRQKGALGLGLTLVKRIAESHGGSAFAANREEGGARVGIELPISSA